MRVTRETLAAHRHGILTAAGRLLRLHGIDGVSVAEVMREAGLTHGGFYGHFRSKTELVASACRDVLAGSAAKWRSRAMAAQRAGEDPVAAIICAYLSAEHLAHPERGCVLPHLAAETARAGGAPAASMADGLDALLSVLIEFAPGPAGEAAAMAALSAMVGGVVLARTCTDPKRADAMLAAARDAALTALRQAV